MTLEIKLIHHNNFLEVIASGVFNREEAIDRFPYVLSVCRLTKHDKVVIDYRDYIGERLATDKIIYAFGIQDHYNEYLANGGHQLKVAYVGKSDQISSFEPGLQYARKNNLPFELFSAFDEAYTWLGIK